MLNKIIFINQREISNIFIAELDKHEQKLAKIKLKQELAKGKLKYLREENDKFQ